MVYRTLMSKRAGVDQLEDMLVVAAGVSGGDACHDRRRHASGDHPVVAGDRSARPDARPRAGAHGQNWDAMLSDVFFKELEIRTPDRYMGVDTSSLARVYAGVLVGTEEALQEYRPMRCSCSATRTPASRR
jgi:hypothetical protein